MRLLTAANAKCSRSAALVRFSSSAIVLNNFSVMKSIRRMGLVRWKLLWHAGCRLPRGNSIGAEMSGDERIWSVFQ